MATDLNQKKASDSTKVVGADSVGSETNYLKVDAAGSLYNVITSPNGGALGIAATITGPGELRVSPPASSLLYDKFEGSSIDGQQWTSESGNSGSDTLANGLTLGTGTTASAYASITSIPLLQQRANVHLNFGATLKLESGTPRTNVYRFIGYSTGGNNTTTNPMSDGIGFEWDTLGVMCAVVYSGGSKIYSQSLTALTDGDWHRLSMSWRTDACYFYVDGNEVPVATAAKKVPSVQVLPVRMLMINGATPPSGAPVFQVTAIGIGDTGKNSVAISDSRYPWRQASILPNGIIPISDATHFYTYQGKAFTVTSGVQTIALTSEIALLLINNPTNSGKIFKVGSFHFGAPTSNNTNALYRIYLNPTISSTGTAVTPSGNRQTGQSASVCTFGSLPTASSNGTLRAPYRASSNSGDLTINKDHSIFLEPGNKLLITVQTSTTALSAHVTVDFIEEER